MGSDQSGTHADKQTEDLQELFQRSLALLCHCKQLQGTLDLLALLN